MGERNLPSLHRHRYLLVSNNYFTGSTGVAKVMVEEGEIADVGKVDRPRTAYKLFAIVPLSSPLRCVCGGASFATDMPTH